MQIVECTCVEDATIRRPRLSCDGEAHLVVIHTNVDDAEGGRAPARHEQLAHRLSLRELRDTQRLFVSLHTELIACLQPA